MYYIDMFAFHNTLETVVERDEARNRCTKRREKKDQDLSKQLENIHDFCQRAAYTLSPNTKDDYIERYYSWSDQIHEYAYRISRSGGTSKEFKGQVCHDTLLALLNSGMLINLDENSC